MPARKSYLGHIEKQGAFRIGADSQPEIKPEQEDNTQRFLERHIGLAVSTIDKQTSNDRDR
jgi:hypothetical protein